MQVLGAVAWNQCCLAKKAEELALRALIYGTKAAMIKYVWAVATKKDNL